MRRMISLVGVSMILFCSWSMALPRQKAAPKPDPAKVLGTWNLEIDANGMTITLTLVLNESGGLLAGKISEDNGMFTDAPLSDIEYDGDNLAYDISVPSPPDGLVKTWRTQLKVGDDVADGDITNADLGISIALTGKRVKK
jgi:hypothetical protein